MNDDHKYVARRSGLARGVEPYARIDDGRAASLVFQDEASASASASATRLRARDRDGSSKHAFMALANRVRTHAITAHAENAVDGRGRFVQPRRRCETTATRGERATTTRRDRDERLHRAHTCGCAVSLYTENRRVG